MSLSDYAKRKALDFATNVYEQADPDVNTSTGSAIKSLILLPFALIYAAVFQDIEVLRNLFIGNYSNISVENMDLLAGNLLVERPQGTRSTTNLKIYTSELSTFSLQTFPYFRSAGGAEYTPVRVLTYTPADFFSENGEYYVNVPIISTDFGATSRAASGEISRFVNLPVPGVIRVLNEEDTQGGDSRLSNSEFFTYIQDAVNDGSLNQIGGSITYIRDNYPEVTQWRVVDAGDPLLLRDEVWTDDGINPNLSRLGEPFAAHTALGTLDFDKQYGRAYAAGAFDATMEGERIAITGDDEKFRTVLKVIDSDYIVYSGYPITGSADAELWGYGPKIKTMADIYLYFPSIQIQSAIIDKRFFLVASNDTTVPNTRIYYNFAEGFSYDEIPSSGRVTIREGLDSEEITNVVGAGIDATGAYFDVDSLNASVSTGDDISIYDMGEIIVGEDILDRPVLYVLQVDELDPLSFEVTQTIPRSEPGQFNDAGWYVSNTDPAEVFSARENKSIVLDDKRGLSAYIAIDEDLATIQDSSSHFTATTETTSGQNIIQKTGASAVWAENEGREITITFDNYTLADETDNLAGAAVAGGAGTGTLTITGMNVEYDGRIGFRDDIRVVLYDGGMSFIAAYTAGSIMAYGDKLQLKGGSFNASTAFVDVEFPVHVETADPFPASPQNGDLVWFDLAGLGFFPESDAAEDQPVLYVYNGATWVVTSIADSSAFIKGETLESVILTTSGDQIEVLATSGLPTIKNSTGIRTNLAVAEVTAPSEEGTFTSAPVRVLYATHSAIGDLQTTYDDGAVQLLCKDTLIRSFYPSTIDTTITYRGSSTSSEVFNRFIDLLQTAISETNSGADIRLDISNIVAALDEEGLTDSLDVNFEIRVTNWLSDGETEVRYINPAEETKQQLVFDADTTSGVDRILLRRDTGTAAIPGRGKLYLGGRNPNAQEMRLYEAVVDNGDDTFTFIFRGGETLEFDHDQWETAQVTVRDYDPELEYKKGAIYIPANNRPYVRQLVVIKS